jgi:hypothetical protein
MAWGARPRPIFVEGVAALAMSRCVAGAGDRSSLPPCCRRTSTTVSPTGRPRASISIRRSGEAIVGIEDHGIPGADFSVVLADSVAEDDIRTRCMATARVAADGLMRRERAEQRGCAHSMMLLSQQMRIVIGGRRSNKSDRPAFGRSSFRSDQDPSGPREPCGSR